MLELNVVKEQYSRMTDDELQRFAINESDKLTIESFHLLKREFEERNLDLQIIESAQIDKSLTELSKISNFEKITATEFAESIWQFALDEKELGKTNYDIYNSLLHKGIDEKYAFMLTQSLDTKSKELTENYNNELIAGWIILLSGLLTIYLSFNGTLSGLFGLYGFIITAGGGLRIHKSSEKIGKYKKISDNIDLENENSKSG